MKEENKNNQKINTKIIAIVVVLVIIVAIIGGIVGNDLNQKAILVQEVNKLVKNTDLSSETIDVNDIKASGKYAEVEKAIKTYLNDYAVEVQKLVTICGDEKITKLLSIDNYKEDGPEFTETLAYIDEVTKQIDESSEKAIKLMEKDEMFKYIDNYDLSDKYKELYKTLMLDEETEKDLKEAQTQLQDTIDTLKSNLEVAKETLNFLKENKSEWQIQNNLVMFNNSSLLSQYNTLTRKLK
ncbi:MAG: hypothetical protein IJE05_04590 [Clostridia bacterium]|nr:hypothetical protein [Clostridia bacterium]